MAKDKKCSKPVSLIDIYPTINDLLQVSAQPNSQTNQLQLDGFSLRPFLMNPKTDQWQGPKVAITALPGKDHSMSKEFSGAPFPHFSVRSEDWRYTLTSNGEEELYHYPSDSKEAKNLASSPEYTQIKAQLKKQLIKLRDGDKWESLNQWGNHEPNSMASDPFLVSSKPKHKPLSSSQDYHNFELEFDYKTDASEMILGLRANQQINSLPATHQKWNHVRLRLDQNRMEIWINNRLISDSRVKLDKAGPITFTNPQLNQESQIRKIRIRQI